MDSLTTPASNGVTAQTLASIIPGRKKTDVSNANNAKLSAPPKWKEVTGEALMNASIEALPFLWEPILRQVGIACLAGSSDTGKSMFLRQLAIAVAGRHSSFMGYPLKVRYGSVIIISTEDDEQSIRFLLRKQASQHEARDMAGLRFIFDPENPLAALRVCLKQRPADLVIIDAFGDVFQGALNDSQDVRRFLNAYQQLASESGCQILFLHHTGKRTENFEPSKSNLLGSQGFEAKMRLVLELRRDHTNPTQRHLCIVKGNYIPSQMKGESYVLDFDEQKFTFSNSNERVPFEMLAKQVQEDPSKAKWELCVTLMNQGLKGKALADRLGFANNSGVSKLKSKAEERGWITPNVSNEVSKVSNGKQSEDTNEDE